MFGGNDLHVIFDGKRVNLHALWDTHLLRHTFTRNHPLPYFRRLLRRRAIRFLTSPKAATIPIVCDAEDIKDVGQCIQAWASTTNRVNCRRVWRGLSVCNNEVLPEAYIHASQQELINLIVLAAMRTALLLQSFCVPPFTSKQAS